MYHPIKVGVKRIISLDDIIETVIFWFNESSIWPWLWRWQNNPYAWHNTLPHDDVSPYQVWWQRVQQQLRKYVDKYQINMNLHLEHSNLMFLQDTPNNIMTCTIKLGKLWLQKDRKIETVLLIITHEPSLIPLPWRQKTYDFCRKLAYDDASLH